MTQPTQPAEEFTPMIAITPPPALEIGQRVRTLVNLTSAKWDPAQPDIPAGALGTIDSIEHYSSTRISSYGVLLDDSVAQLSASLNPDEIEAAE